MTEIWKGIKGCEDLYQVSNTGKVKSLKYNHTSQEKILKPQKQTNGYFTVNLFGRATSIHRLVAQAFVPNAENKPVINHKDGNKENNSADNLEWCTPRENTIHAVKNGLIRYDTPSRHQMYMVNIQKAIGHNKKKILQFDLNGSLIGEYDSIIYASYVTHCNATHISLCAKGKHKTSGGFVWRYAD